MFKTGILIAGMALVSAHWNRDGNRRENRQSQLERWKQRMVLLRN